MKGVDGLGQFGSQESSSLSESGPDTIAMAPKTTEGWIVLRRLPRIFDRSSSQRASTRFDSVADIMTHRDICEVRARRTGRGLHRGPRNNGEEEI